MGVGSQASWLLLGQVLLEELVQDSRHQEAQVRIGGLQGLEEMDSS